MKTNFLQLKLDQVQALQQQGMPENSIALYDALLSIYYERKVAQEQGFFYCGTEKLQKLCEFDEWFVLKEAREWLEKTGYISYEKGDVKSGKAATWKILKTPFKRVQVNMSSQVRTTTTVETDTKDEEEQYEQELVDNKKMYDQKEWQRYSQSILKLWNNPKWRMRVKRDCNEQEIEQLKRFSDGFSLAVKQLDFIQLPDRFITPMYHHANNIRYLCGHHDSNGKLQEVDSSNNRSEQIWIIRESVKAFSERLSRPIRRIDFDGLLHNCNVLGRDITLIPREYFNI